MTDEKQLTKEEFFRDELVPTGQILELFLLQAGRHMRTRREFTSYQHTLRDVLNLVSVWAINPTSTDLSCVVLDLGAARSAMLEMFTLVGTTRGQALHALFQGQTPKLTSAQTGKLQKGFLEATTKLMYQVNHLRMHIGYNDGVRHQWIRDQLTARSPLTNSGRTNRWRTFVRNGSWRKAVEYMDLESWVKPPAYTDNRWGTDVGRVHAKELWQQTFSNWNVSAASEAPDDELGAKLPAGVNVASTLSGKLEVSARFDPRSLLTREQAALLKTHKVPEDLTKQLMSQDFSRTCSFLLLPETVAEAHSWLLERKETAPAIMEQVKAWEELQRRTVLLSKFRKTFTADEQATLIAVFTEKPASAAA